jgi:hypothetical protein
MEGPASWSAARMLWEGNAPLRAEGREASSSWSPATTRAAVWQPDNRVEVGAPTGIGVSHPACNGALPPALPPARHGNGAPAALSDDDYCVVISRPSSPEDPSRVGSADADAELNRDGIAFIGSHGKRQRPQALPHSRPDCPLKPFVLPPVGAKRAVGGNGERCELCWCYVCDVVAADCQQWDSRDNNWPAHCNAHGGEPLWKKMREERRR